MARKFQTEFTGVHWIKQRPLSDVTDPLGMNLRVGARLGAQLLYCITSVTQRARYYSFLPWCIMRYRETQRGAPGDPGLFAAVFAREKALAIGCVAHHEGESCARGGVVGTRRVERNLERFDGKSFVPRDVELVQDPALGIYVASLVNLGLIKETGEEPTEVGDDAAAEDEEAQVASWDDVQLTSIGRDVAEAYERAIRGKMAAVQVDKPTTPITWEGAAAWASAGGYCELAIDPAPDRAVLVDLFFCRRGPKGKSHDLRRQTLLLLLALAVSIEEDGGYLDRDAFMAAVYAGRVQYAEGDILVAVPDALVGVAAQWKAYGAHVLLTTALQCLLAHVTNSLQSADAHRVSLSEFAQSLSDPALADAFAKHAEVELTERFGELSPERLMATLYKGPLSEHPSALAHELAARLSEIDVRGGPAGLALALTLTSLILEDYSNWRDEPSGLWLAKASNDDTDVSPAVMLKRLEQRFGDWRKTSWQELTPYLLRKFVVGLHSNLAYEKQGRLLYLEGDQVRGDRPFNDVWASFPRLRSALTILQDLALLEEDEDGALGITSAGRELLSEELNGGQRQ